MTIHLRVTVDLHLSEEKIRQEYGDTSAAEYLHVLSGGDLHAGHHPSLTRAYYVETLAWDAIMGRDRHGTNISESETCTIEEMSPPTITRGAADEFCPTCRHYPGSHTADGCQDGDSRRYEDGTYVPCTCKVPGPLVLRHQ